VYDFVKTAWDKEEIMSLVRKTELKGNIKINFEISGSDAVVHTEGGEAVPEEQLVEGIVTIVPAFIKKWISVSDEVLGLRGEAFLNYIYDELTHKIAKKAADQLVGIIAALPQTATATSPAADKITVAPAADTVAQAFGHLSDEAANPVIIMNKLTYAEFKAVQYANNYGVDVFEGLQVKFNNTLPAYSTANAGQVYMIVGDLGEGTDANFPNGIGNIEFTFDALTKKKEDLVEILGKEYVGLGVITNKAFTLVAKPGSI
jgi:HK97 family phage major capsid protein